MCIVSMIMDYGRERAKAPVTEWSPVAIEDFRKLVKTAEAFDKSAGEPDCVDPEKEKFMQELDERVKVLEAEKNV